MRSQLSDIRRFLYGQHFADGLRMTILIILPAFIASYCGHFDIGLTISIGALGVSIADTPGPAVHKRNAMFAASGFIFLACIATGFLRMNIYAMGTGLTLMAFFFAMITIYGARVSLIGSGVLLVMILQIDKDLTPAMVVENGALVTAGCLWYAIVSTAILWLTPYKAAQRALGECVQETAAYLSLRSKLYDTSMPLTETFNKLIAQQIVLNDKQNEVRDLLFKNKKILRESTRRAQVMVVTFDEVMDLYEKISASHLDYDAIRSRYMGQPILKQIVATISELAVTLDKTGEAIQYNIAPGIKQDLPESINDLSEKINAIVANDKQPVLDSLLINVQNMSRVVNDLQHYFSADYPLIKTNNKTLDHSLFVSHQDFSLRLFRYNLTFDSLTFRHSVRMALACLTGFMIAKFIAHGHHSYWILITIIFVLKPAFSLTRQRNIDRLTGTLAGGVLSVVILLFVHSTVVLFALLFICMLVTYSFQRHRYAIAVIFMTPYILILFHFMGIGLLEVAEERVIDTIIGSIIALVAGYLILPDWESDQLKGYTTAMLYANSQYLKTVADSLQGTVITITNYKLIRKEVYVGMSNLSAALQRMLSEPKRTRKNAAEIQNFAMLNFLLTSYIAAAKEYVQDGSKATQADSQWISVALAILHDSIRSISENKIVAAMVTLQDKNNRKDVAEIKDPFESIYITSVEIKKITDKLVSEK